MTKLYKLTDAQGRTHTDTQWGEGVTHTATGPLDGELCSSSFIHAYTSPLLAVLLNPIHAAFNSPRLFEAEGDILKQDHGLKVGVRSLTILKESPIPVFTVNQRIAFSIYCVLSIDPDPSFENWAYNWLDGKDRSRAAAEAASRAACWAASYGAADAASRSAAEAASWAAARAAAGAADAASRSAAEGAARAAAGAADAASRSAADVAAEAAADVASYAAAFRAAGTKIDLIALAEKAYNFERVPATKEDTNEQ